MGKASPALFFVEAWATPVVPFFPASPQGEWSAARRARGIGDHGLPSIRATGVGALTIRPISLRSEISA
jgi:hypothetical protein